MSVSADRVAMADQVVLRTFARSSIAWQAIPHWDTGDRGQNRVRDDRQAPAATEESDDAPPAAPFASGSLPVVGAGVRFRVTLSQAMADTPDALLAAVIARSVTLAGRVDKAVFETLVEAPSTSAQTSVQASEITTPGLLEALLRGRARLEDVGLHAPSTLIAGPKAFLALNQIEQGRFVLDDMLAAADIGSLYRSTRLGDPNALLLLGRRQDIAHRCAAEASAGEEPVDLAVSVFPSLEVVGDYPGAPAEIELGVRIRYAARVKHDGGVVPITLPSS